MKIVLLVHHFPPRYSAGAELYTLWLARGLRRRGHLAEVVCIERVDDPMAMPLLAHLDHYQGVPVWRLALNLAAAPDPLAWSYDNPAIKGWLATYLKTFAADLVHLQGGYLIGVGAMAAARAAGVPCVVTLHDFWFLCPRITLLRGDGSLCGGPPDDPAVCAWCRLTERRRYRWLDWATAGAAGHAARGMLGDARRAYAARRERLLAALALADAAVAPSPFVANMFAPHVEPGRLHTLRIGLDTDALAEVSPRPTGGPLRLGYIGQIAPHKGVHVLIEAMRLLPAGTRPVELDLYGSLDGQPAYAARLRRQSAGLPIRFHGRYDNQQLAAILADLDVVVVPSLWNEVGPLTVGEAHAAGRPALVSAIGNLPMIVCDEVDGLHAQPGDPGDLARQIQRLRDEPELLGRLRAGVRPPPSLDDEHERLIELYTALVQAARSSMSTSLA